MPNGRSDPRPPNDGDLKHSNLRAGGDGGTDTAAPKKDEQESSEELANEPMGNVFHVFDSNLF